MRLDLLWVHPGERVYHRTSGETFTVHSQRHDGLTRIIAEVGGKEFNIFLYTDFWVLTSDKLADPSPKSDAVKASYLTTQATKIIEASEDVVNHPSHYKFANGVEVIALTEQLNFNCGNVVKYTARAGRKDASKQLEDLRKAEFYIKREIARVENLGEDL